MKGAVFLYLVLAVTMLGQELTPEGYQIATPNPTFSFPQDHGSHPGFRIEWWYITGKVRDEEGRPFGLQATFFRYALKPGVEADKEPFGTKDIHMAHMAVSDIKSGRLLHEERLNRDGWDALARVGDLHVQNGNWSLQRTSGETMALTGSVRSDAHFALVLKPVKPKLLFGEDGWSKKGVGVENASWYITFPRLAVSGRLSVDGRERAVSGEAWMDHEISSSQLDKTQVGWDWLSIRLHDQTEVMLYILRDGDGQPTAHSKLAWIDREGGLVQRGPAHFNWEVIDTWTSPQTGGVYPQQIRLRATRPDGSRVDWTVRPWFAEQEMVGHLGGISYWEGGCDILQRGNVIGDAYLELTGYAEPLAIGSPNSR